jgi:hypothetical protein
MLGGAAHAGAAPGHTPAAGRCSRSCRPGCRGRGPAHTRAAAAGARAAAGGAGGAGAAAHTPGRGPPAGFGGCWGGWAAALPVGRYGRSAAQQGGLQRAGRLTLPLALRLPITTASTFCTCEAEVLTCARVDWGGRHLFSRCAGRWLMVGLGEERLSEPGFKQRLRLGAGWVGGSLPGALQGLTGWLAGSPQPGGWWLCRSPCCPRTPARGWPRLAVVAWCCGLA